MSIQRCGGSVLMNMYTGNIIRLKLNCMQISVLFNNKYRISMSSTLLYITTTAHQEFILCVEYQLHRAFSTITVINKNYTNCLHYNFIKGIQKEEKEVLFSEAADIFQGIPHSHHSSQVFIISSSFNEYSPTCCSVRYISICQEKKKSATVNTLISRPTTSSM